MDWIINIGKLYGPFVALVAFVLWDGHRREAKYLEIIKTLSEDVKERLTKIESTLRRRA